MRQSKRKSSNPRNPLAPREHSRPLPARTVVWLAGGAALLLLVAVLASWVRNRPSEIRREGGLNVLLITIDTLRADALGAYGNPRGTSPWIDRLAGAGVRFETVHAHSVVTLPSHANILSGHYPFEHGVRDNAGFRFPSRIETLATRLKARGYRTGAFVSGFPVDSRFGLDRGFDLYEDSFAKTQPVGAFQLPERHAPDTVALARRWLDQKDERPFLCWVHLYDPHAPYAPPEPYASQFADAPYLGEVAAADAALQALFQPLLERGAEGRALVVLTADHGESLGEHGEKTHGLFAYEATLRVPLVLFAPPILDPRVVREPVRHIDIVPTILDALGLPVPGDLPGRSLLTLASGRPQPAAPAYFEALSGMLGRGWAPLYGVVQSGTKYIDLPLPELYDLGEDGKELRNLVATGLTGLESLQRTLGRFRAQDRGVTRSEETADTRERLAALGYVAAASAPLKTRYTAEDDPKRLVDLDSLMQEVIALHRRGDLPAALKLCQEVVRRRPEMPASLLQLALLYRKLAQMEPAIEALQRAFRQNPDDLTAVVLLGSYLNDAGRAAEAADLLGPYAARADPPLDVLTTRGVALARLGRAREALATFEAARATDPSNPMTLVQIGTVHLTSGQGVEAEKSFRAALRLNPDMALAHHNLGLLALSRHDDAEAERCFRRALELESGDDDALLNLGSLLARRGRAAEARSYLERFVRQAPRGVYARQLDRVQDWLGRAGH
jgi:arylsulfatase A-like enzyme/Flp pilus assembly protein TadD